MAIIFHILKIKVLDPEQVYNALTTSKGLAAWWTTEVEAVPETDSVASFYFEEKYHKSMRVVELLPDRRVLWQCLEGHPQWLGTTIAFEIEPVAGGIQLRFYHAGWEAETDLFGSCNYHWGLYLRSLKSYLETGQGMPHSCQTLEKV